MHIVTAQDSVLWTKNVLASTEEVPSFLHSWEWADVQEGYGRTVHRLHCIEEDQVISSILLIEHRLPFGKKYVFTPRGPVMSAGQEGRMTEVYHLLEKYIRRELDVIFWRFEPFIENLPKHVVPVPDIQPAVTEMIHLDRSEEELFAAMKQKTRYNIRLAAKKGVMVEFFSVGSHWETLANEWWSLLEETSARHGIRNHPLKYYEKMFSVMGEAGVLQIVRAEHEGDLLVMNVIILYGNTMTYLHGASTHIKKQLMAPYAAQWKSIQRAQESGFDFYDFYGVAPTNSSDHSLAGVTRFKKGFGGFTHTYLGTFELPISRWWYTIYRIMKRIRI